MRHFVRYQATMSSTRGHEPELTIVIPTLNERDNIESLVKKLSTTLDGISWEAIFVDDNSQDGTLEVLQELSQSLTQVRYIRRIGRRGLASACIEGLSASSAPYLAVMDADLQHDETLLKQMLETLKSGDAELVNGSRYITGGDIDSDWDTNRRWLSQMGTRLGQTLLNVSLTDPLSGFFMLRRTLFEEAAGRMSALGFKVLFDLVTSVDRSINIIELPYKFRQRQAGSSKLDTQVLLEYLELLLNKTMGQYMPARFLIFAMVGATGVVVHLMILGFLLHLAELAFVWSQTVATCTAMFSNYALNNLFTYRDRHLSGVAFIRGLIMFVLISAVGALTNVSLASFAYGHGLPWWLAGFAGTVVGAVWNYAVSSSLVWSRTR